MLEKMIDTISKHQMIEAGDCVIVAFSGGPDSSAMIHALYHLKETFKIRLVGVHVNHMLRKEAANRDAAYVASFCKSFGIPYEIYEINVPQYALENGYSFEEAGRKIRYDCLNRALKKHKGTKIAIGQNRNDVHETFFINLFRGSGIDGLGSIDYVRDALYIRPLLDIDRSEIEAYCTTNNITACIDHTNLENDYIRNRIRNELLPYIQKNFNPSFDETLSKTVDLLKMEKDFWKCHTLSLFNRCVIENTGDDSIVRLSVQEISKLHEVEQLNLLRHVIQRVRGNLTNIPLDIYKRILKLNRTGSRILLDDQHEVVAQYNELIFQKTVKQKGLSKHPQVRISYREKHEVDQIVGTGLDEVMVDALTLKGTLTVRHRRNGDRFVPLGMKGHKKLKDFLIDEKIPSDKRDDIWLICDEEKIVWVYGIRISDACKITKNTKKIAVISLGNVVQ